MYEIASVEDIKRSFLNSGEVAARHLLEGYKEALSIIPDIIIQNRFAYALFVKLPYWLSIGENGEPSTTLLHRHGAYIIYKTQAEDDLEASFALAMLGRYSAASVLLRSSLELLCRGAFFDGIAKRDLREGCKLLSKKTKKRIDNKRRSIEDLFNDLSKLNPQLYDDFELNSGCILDKLSVFSRNRLFQNMFPSFYKIVEQLERWGHFHPIDDSINLVYHGGYHLLSLPTHGHIDSLDIGRRMLDGESMFAQPTRRPNYLESYLSNFDQLLDLGLVLTFNLITRHPETPGIQQTLDKISSFPLFTDTNVYYFKKCIDQYSP